MKKLILIIVVVILSLFAGVLFGQVSVGLNIGVNSPRYYFLSDIGVYWDIGASVYIYPSGNRWIRGRSLPAYYGHYDFEHGHRVSIDGYRGNRPYNYYNQHRTQFPKGHFDNNPGKDSWSYKEHKNQGFKQNGSFKGNRSEKGNGNHGNGNNGNGNGKGRGNGNGGGHGGGGGHKK